MQILHVRIDSFRAFSMYARILFAFSPCTHMEIRIRIKKVSHSTLPDDYKGTVFRRKLNGGLFNGLARTNKFFFFAIFKTNFCSLRIWRILFLSYIKATAVMREDDGPERRGRRTCRILYPVVPGLLPTSGLATLSFIRKGKIYLTHNATELEI
jgi:hypothetical protein